MINSNGEFFDLEKKFNKTQDPTTENGRCSGLVKVSSLLLLVQLIIIKFKSF